MEKGILRIFLGAVLTLTLMSNPAVSLAESKRVVCYVQDTFSPDPQTFESEVSRLDISFCTDLVMSFCFFDPATLSIKWETDRTKNLGETLKRLAGNKRVLLGVGGGSEQAEEGFQNFVKASEITKITAIDSLWAIANEGSGYDGIDIDWEFPNRGKDFEDFMKLILSGSGSKKVSIAVYHYYLDPSRDSYNLLSHSKWANSLNYINIMGYDLNSVEGGKINPELPNSPINLIQEDCEKIVDAGIDISKINVLLPYYFRYGNHPKAVLNWGEKELLDVRNIVSSIPSEFVVDDEVLERRIQKSFWPQNPLLPFPMSDFFYVVDPYSMYRKVKYLTIEKRISTGFFKKGNVGGVGVWQLAQQDFEFGTHAEMGQAILAGINNQKNYSWPPPFISSIDPPSASIGSEVRINGGGFGTSASSCKVLFSNNKKASVKSWGNNQIICTVPKGASTGNIVVVTKSGTSKGFPFTCIVAENISTPNFITGPTSGTVGTSYEYTTGGSSSNLGHSVIYQFDWKGDGTDLSPFGSATQSKKWNNPGTYNVKTRGQCSTHSSAISSWSKGLSVKISSQGFLFQGGLTGSWSGTCRESGYSYSVMGGFSMSIDANGNVSGSYNGDDWGNISGIVKPTGEYNARGTAGEISWIGKISRSGNSLSGNGTWSGTADGLSCSGTWSGSGTASSQ